MSQSPNPATVLVTGAGGCIGAHVVAALLRGGDRPGVFDISEDRRRLALLVDEAGAAAVPWIAGDLRDTAAVARALETSRARAVIHLAALQVPFCNADPVRGAEVNVVGHVNLFEAARAAGVPRIAWASSIAALPPPGSDRPATLYGAFKQADETIAAIYARERGVASIGIRPHTVYGPGRDQGVTAAPTKAMLAAAAGLRFTIPFAGPIMMQHAEEVADAFIRAALAPVEGAHVCDLAGADTTVEAIAAAIRAVLPGADIAVAGEPLPFRAGQSDADLRALVGNWPHVGLADGVARTIAAFQRLLQRGLVAPENAYRDPLGQGRHGPYEG